MPLALLALAGCLSLAQPDAAEAAWSNLLAMAGLTTDQAQVAPGRWKGGGRSTLPAFDSMWDDWRRIDPFATNAASRLTAAAGSLSGLLWATTAMLAPDRASTAAAPQATTPTLLDALAAVHQAAGQPLDAAAREALSAKLSAVPAPVAAAAAGILAAVPETLARRAAALAGWGGPETWPRAYDLALRLGTGYQVEADTLKLLDTVDPAAVADMAAPLAAAVDALDPTALAAGATFAFACDTPLGHVALHGGGNDTYEAGSYLLILDVGGDDTYHGGGSSAGLDHPVSVLIDLAGTDHYQMAEGGAFGVGVLGVGLLVDGGGDDVYEAQSIAFGLGIAGVGMLLDRAGNDHYTSRTLGQGAGCLGVGVLSDLAGNDEYHCYELAQGYAQVKGCGVLVDLAGDDLYDANDTDIVDPSPQTKEHNTSLAQGCGFGRRAHPGDGNSLGGGIGVLVDGAGDDRYSAGLFAQGASYWYSTGLLVDQGGDDSYQGVWYVQGSSAHYGVAELRDVAGDDSYHALMTQSVGSGHDYSVAMLHDLAGNDHYACPGNCLGWALWNGIGLFRDDAGDDTYEAQSSCLGGVGAARKEHSCYGLFLDLGGHDTYPAGGEPQNGVAWRRPPNDAVPLGAGLGLDLD